VAAAPHRESEAGLAGELHRALNVGNTGTSRYQRWSPIDVPVPYPPARFVASVPGSDQLAAKGLLKPLELYRVHWAVIRLGSARSQPRHDDLPRYRRASVWLSSVNTAFEHFRRRVVHYHLGHTLIAAFHDFMTLRAKHSESV
jgi:hypothetical protein